VGGFLGSLFVEVGPTVSCPTDISVNQAAGECSQLVAFAPVLTGFPAPTLVCEWNGNPITSPFSFPVGSNTVTCTASNLLGVQSCSFSIIVLNTNPPVAGANSLGTHQGQAVSVPVAKLLLRDKAPSGGPLSITGVVSPTLAGAVVSLAGGSITYTSPPNYIGQDTVTYTLSDGCGTASGSIAVTVLPNVPTQNLGSLTQTAEGTTVVFHGIPGGIYLIQSAPAPSGPWTNLGAPIVAGSNGLLEGTDTTAPLPVAQFYRTQYVSGP
jgi:hypothetical protein